LDDERLYCSGKKISEFMSGPSSPVENSSNNDNVALFTMCLESEEGYDLVTIYENEDDYEGQITEVCDHFRMSERRALHFKINILQMIKECASSLNEKLEESLNRLLNLNYNILLEEHVASDNNEYDEILSDVKSLFEN